MIQKLGLICLIMVCTAPLFAQVAVPEFAYVIVPEKFEFQSAENTYQINDLTIFLLKKNGFNAVSEKTLNRFDPCDALFADLEMENGLVLTKATLILRNCKGVEVVRTVTGRSKVKDYKKAYHEAIRNALKNFKKNDLTMIPSEVEIIELPKPSESFVTDELQESGVAKAEVDAKISEEKKKPIGQTKNDTISSSEDEVYTFESYAIVRNNSNYILVNDDTLIGALIPSIKEGVFLVKTTQFYGVAYKKDGAFHVEREVSGLKNLVSMVFSKQD